MSHSLEYRWHLIGEVKEALEEVFNACYNLGEARRVDANGDLARLIEAAGSYALAQKALYEVVLGNADGEDGA